MIDLKEGLIQIGDPVLVGTIEPRKCPPLIDVGGQADEISSRYRQRIEVHSIVILPREGFSFAAVT